MVRAETEWFVLSRLRRPQLAAELGDLWTAHAVRTVAAVERGRGRGGGGRAGADRGTDPGGLAASAGHRAGRRGVLAGGADSVVRGAGGSGLRARAGAERIAAAGGEAAAGSVGRPHGDGHDAGEPVGVAQGGARDGTGAGECAEDPSVEVLPVSATGPVRALHVPAEAAEAARIAPPP